MQQVIAAILCRSGAGMVGQNAQWCAYRQQVYGAAASGTDNAMLLVGGNHNQIIYRFTLHVHTTP